MYVYVDMDMDVYRLVASGGGGSTMEALWWKVSRTSEP